MRLSNWTIDVDSFTHCVVLWNPEWGESDWQNYQIMLSQSRAHGDYKVIMVF
jgi:hypothetical protein